ncbi:MAG: hypothetical protein WA118_02650 [Carboxydocellales bacterium]
MKNLDLLRKKLQYSLDARELAKKLNLHCFTELDFMVLKLELEIKKLEQET